MVWESKYFRFSLHASQIVFKLLCCLFPPVNPFDGLCSRVIYNSSGDLWISCQAQFFLASAPPRDAFSRERLFPRVCACISQGSRLPAVYSRVDGFEYSEAVCEQ